MKQPAIKSAPKTTIPLSERLTLTVDEFCKMIGIGRSTFYKAVGVSLEGDRPGRPRLGLCTLGLAVFNGVLAVADQSAGFLRGASRAFASGTSSAVPKPMYRSLPVTGLVKRKIQDRLPFLSTSRRSQRKEVRHG